MFDLHERNAFRVRDFLVIRWGEGNLIARFEGGVVISGAPAVAQAVRLGKEHIDALLSLAGVLAGGELAEGHGKGVCAVARSIGCCLRGE